MPPSPTQTTGAVGYAVLGLFAAGLVAAVVFSMTGRVIVVGLVLLLLVDQVGDRRRLRRLALFRQGEDLCSFARAFDRRTTNYWVVRAVYDELRPYCTFRGGRVPLRPSDSLEQELRIGSDDLTDIARDATVRTGRVFENLQANPLYGRVSTVADLIAFVQYQPSASPPAASLAVATGKRDV